MRAVNRIAAGLLGLLLFAAGILVVVNAVLVLAGHRPWPLPLDSWFARWGGLPISDGRAFWICVAIGVVGLVILGLQVRRWRPDRLPAGESAGSGWWLTRRAVRLRAETAAAGVAGVKDVHARLRGGRRRRLRVLARALPERRDAVRSRVRAELDRLTVPSDVDVDVVLRPPVRRVA